MNACFRKLHEVILDAGRNAVPGETSVQTKKRVEGFKEAEKVRRRREKEYRSDKKAGRRSGGRGDD